MMVIVGSLQHSPQSFRWSIDQLAILKPADIEEHGNQEDMCVHGLVRHDISVTTTQLAAFYNCYNGICMMMLF